MSYGFSSYGSACYGGKGIEYRVYSISPIDGISLSEVLSRELEFYRIFPDSITLSEDLLKNIEFYRMFIDGLSILEVLSKESNRTTLDVLNLYDELLDIYAQQDTARFYFTKFGKTIPPKGVAGPFDYRKFDLTRTDVILGGFQFDAFQSTAFQMTNIEYGSFEYKKYKTARPS